MSEESVPHQQQADEPVAGGATFLLAPSGLPNTTGADV